MKIESEDRKSNIDIEYFDCELERYPSVCVKIDVLNNGFIGMNKDVWFELGKLKEFVVKLKLLDENRNGKASIESMSPEEFQLQIESVDLSGHFVLKFKISKYTYCIVGLLTSLTGGFGLDSSDFKNIVDDFKRLTDEKMYPPPRVPMI